MSGPIIQYKVLTEPPVQPPGTHPVWYQKFSEPTRRVALTTAVLAAASGLTWTPQPISGSNDVRVVSPADATVPKRPAFLYRYPSTTDVFVFASVETVTLDKWNSRLSEPTRKIAAQQQSFLSWLPQPVSGSGDVAISSTNAVVLHQRTLLYPSIADVIISTAAAETITTDKWHAPLSQPLRSRGPASSQSFFYFVKSEDVSVDRWLQSLHQPTRSRLGNYSQSIIVKADPFPETVSIDKWEQPFSEPKRFAKNLNVHHQPFAYFVKADPFPETVSADRWQQPLSEPTRRRGYPTQAQDELSFIGSDVATDARWFFPLSEPTRRKLLAEFPSLSWSQFIPASTEVITIDKYFAWLAEPRRFPRELAFNQHPYISFVKADPFPETVSADRWQQPLSEPTRRRGYPTQSQDELSFVGSDIARDSRWFAPLSEPTRRRPLAEFPVLSWSQFTPAATEVVTVDKYFSWLAEPRRFPRELAFNQHPYFSFVKASPFTETVSIDRWQQPLSIPTRRIRFAEYPAFSYASRVVETITLDKWLSSLSQPVLRRVFLGLRTFEQPWTPQPVSGSGDVVVSYTNVIVPYQRTLLYPSITNVIVAADFSTLDKWFSTLSQPTRRKVNISSYMSPIFIAPTFQIETITIDKWFETLSQPTLRKVSFPTLASSSGEAPYVIFFYSDHTRPPRSIKTSRTNNDLINLRDSDLISTRPRPRLSTRLKPNSRRGKPPNYRRDN